MGKVYGMCCWMASTEGPLSKGGGDWQERGDELRQASPMGSNQRLLGKPRGGRGKAGQVGGMSRSTLEV